MLNYLTQIEDKKGSEGEKLPEGHHDLTRFEWSRPGPKSWYVSFVELVSDLAVVFTLFFTYIVYTTDADT